MVDLATLARHHYSIMLINIQADQWCGQRKLVQHLQLFYQAIEKQLGSRTQWLPKRKAMLVPSSCLLQDCLLNKEMKADCERLKRSTVSSYSRLSRMQLQVPLASCSLIPSKVGQSGAGVTSTGRWKQSLTELGSAYRRLTLAFSLGPLDHSYAGFSSLPR